MQAAKLCSKTPPTICAVGGGLKNTQDKKCKSNYGSPFIVYITSNKRQNPLAEKIGR